MRNIWTIWRKEMKSYFVSPVAYAVLVGGAMIFGFFFTAATAFFVRRGMMAAAQGMPMDVNEFVIRPLLMNVSVVGLFVTPMIAMRLFAEEKFSGTIELLLTSPIRDIEIIIGKWLGAMTVYAGLLAISAINLIFLFIYGNPDLKPVLVGYLGLLLQGGGLLAIGTFISTTTKNQIVAALTTFGVCLLLWVFEWVSAWETAVWAKIVSYMSVLTHFEPFARGVVDTKDLIYYLSVIFIGLFLSQRSIQSLRWRA